MIKFKGHVWQVADEEREFFDKDKDGNRLSTKTRHRVTTVVMQVKVGSAPNMLTLSGFDLPSTFQLPNEGVEWETPSLRSVTMESPMVYRGRF